MSQNVLMKSWKCQLNLINKVTMESMKSSRATYRLFLKNAFKTEAL